jgi:hypothetical protein
MIASHRLQVHQRGASRYWWLIGLALSAAAFYWLMPRGNPVAPAGLSPEGTLLLGDIPQFRQELRWTQGGVARSLTGPMPGLAIRSVICFYDAAAQADCAAGTNVLHVAPQANDTITRREVPTGNWTDVLKGIVPRYAYVANITLPQTVLDKDIRWTAGACSKLQTDDPGNTSCSFATAKALAFTARDLAANRINDTVLGAQVRTRIEVRNDGRTSGESYRLDTTVWEIRMQPRSNQPLLDVNHADVNASSDVVVSTTGDECPVADYRSGTCTFGEVLGIHPAGWVRQPYSRTITPVPTPLPGGQALAPGTVNGVFDSVDACDTTPCIFTAPRRPSLYAAFTSVNPGSVPWDFEPGDNSKFKNGIYVP